MGLGAVVETYYLKRGFSRKLSHTSEYFKKYPEKSLEVEVWLRLKERHIISSSIILMLSGLTSLTIFNDCFTKRETSGNFFQGLVSFVLLLILDQRCVNYSFVDS